MQVCWTGDAALLRLLLDGGADVSILDDARRTCFHVVAAAPYAEATAKPLYQLLLRGPPAKPGAAPGEAVPALEALLRAAAQSYDRGGKLPEQVGSTKKMKGLFRAEVE